MKFYTIHNDILKDSQRLNILKNVKNLLSDFGPTFPGLQTKAKLHQKPFMFEFLFAIKKFIKEEFSIVKCWGNYSDGKEYNWHKHPTYYSAVYMLDNPLEMGTSFIIDDIAVKIPHFKKESEEAIVFYGDKLIPTELLNYKKIIIDTAGNNYLDLVSLAEYKYPDNSIISISNELLTDELIDLYSIKRGFLILSHSPKKTEIISNGISNSIINEYYLPPNQRLNKIKGI